MISAKVIADSVSSVNGKRITTFELEYPRFIHAEFMTHRMFSRNAASSRAIPVEKMIKQVESNPATPIHWGKNQAGMQAKEELTGEYLDEATCWWSVASGQASESASMMVRSGAHKQIVNRILEPYQFIKVVCTATEFKNFFYLRNHEDAQPEIKKLAEEMFKAREDSKPFKLSPGEWHTPYVGHMPGSKGELWYYLNYADGGDIVLSLEEALKVSASCCAQVSYRNIDDSLSKAEKIYKALVESKPVHASPFEHQATPMDCNLDDRGSSGYEKNCDILCQNGEGVTHMDNQGKLWSGNFCGWIQHRQLIPENVKRG